MDNLMMKILHSGSLNIKTGGPALSTSLIIKALIDMKVSAKMVMHPLDANGKLIREDIPIVYTRKTLEHRSGFCLLLERTLKSIEPVDLYHIQGIWQYLGHGIAKYARKNKKPYLITLRGMLYPQAIQNSIIKKISLLFYQRKDLEKAFCIQVTCEEEMIHYRNMGFKNPVAILPNPIDTERIIEREIKPKNKIRIGYLGRIHPRKKIERLIYAFDVLRDKLQTCELLIIGTDDIAYEAFLKEEVKRLNLANVHFKGFLSGAEKDEIITSLSYLILPSDFENFGNVVTEALVRGVPVIASKGTPWKDLEKYNCGWWIENDQESINHTIEEAVNLSFDENLKMGLNGKKLIQDKFSIEILGEKMKSLYEWILGNGDRPDFVFLD